MYFSFTRPSFLLFLLAVPIFILIHFLTIKQTKAFKFANFDAIERIKGAKVLSKNLTLLYLNLGIIVLFIFALAGTTVHFNARASSFTYVVSIDNSRSMITKDILPSRLEAAKEKSIKFINSAPVGTGIGIVSFSGNSQIRSVISSDKIQAKDAVRGIELSSVGGTDILDAVIISSNLLRNYKNKAVILVTDGQLNVNSIYDLIQYSNNNDLVIHTFGIGTREGGENEIGAISKIDADALEAIAYNTNGKSFFIEDKEDFDEYFKEVIETTEGNVSLEISSYLLIIGIILVILNWVLINTRFKVLP